MSLSLKLQDEMPLWRKFWYMPWGLLLVVTLIASVGFTCLYSAADGALMPWAGKQMGRYLFCAALAIGIALVDTRWWYRAAYPFYVICLVLLVIVEVMGHIGMGAQRWINLGFMQLQPSELMKIAVILALARYFHGMPLEHIRRIPMLFPPLGLIALPFALVALQPDLGTAGKIMMAGGAMFFLAGVPLWLFGAIIAAVLAAIPVGWHFLHDYQRQRVYTFLNPESDPLGSGYHITQSKIALGSGGIDGKGFMKGTQSRLNFLPEKQTDFIFTLWAEEWGLMGGLFLLGLFALVMVYGIWIAIRCRSTFGKLLALGLTINFSLYAFINTAMVMGLIPVVGVPLPLVSYGGTAMLALMIGFGLVMSCAVHRDSKMGRA